MMQALELGKVKTSDNRQRRHCQLQWAQSKAITDCNGRNQRHHCEVPKHSWDKRPSNATRRANAISLGAARRPCRRTQQRHCDNIMSITMILISRWQSLSKEQQSPQCKCDECKQQSGGPLNRKTQADWKYSCLRSPGTRTQEQQQNTR